jgi:hypothetical protein
MKNHQLMVIDHERLYLLVDRDENPIFIGFHDGAEAGKQTIPLFTSQDAARAFVRGPDWMTKDGRRGPGVAIARLHGGRAFVQTVRESGYGICIDPHQTADGMVMGTPIENAGDN